MCCTKEEAAAYKKDMLGVVKTHVAPSYAVHPRTGDAYAAYNKPEAVVDWLEHVTPKEEWVVVLDSDMLLRRPFLPSDFNLSRGWAVGARYDYMIGVDNELADRHIPEIPKVNDTLAGPVGRRSDRVGGFYFIRRDDLKAVAPLWLKYTEDVRADPEAWRLSGDAYSKQRGDKPWISEMYGYSFGAAKAGLRHKYDEESMLYPGYMPNGVPRVLHYGLLYEVQHKGGKWSWDKHWYHGFNLSKAERHRDLIAISVVHTLNAALCEFHMQHCPPSQQLRDVCDKAQAQYQATKVAVRQLDVELSCIDRLPDKCAEWAKSGECAKNEGFMHSNCRKSCNALHAADLPSGAWPVAAAGDAAAAAAAAAGIAGAAAMQPPLPRPPHPLHHRHRRRRRRRPHRRRHPRPPPPPPSPPPPPPSWEALLRAKFPHSSLSFKELIHRQQAQLREAATQ
ncbi:hypothetical protein COO60DRAFT_1675462 [Scenedesmus sp. NREL 46B-D3]|nr:hypothetical protein COO60DRAFT_1675462 [Scenedesmus sp. NREL 46B-D3]